MIERIADLDELLLRCRPGSAKAYAEEAVATYRAGAYRACIITTWIAVVFDLIGKMREIALFGNGEAKKQLEEFDRWQEEIAAGNTAQLRKALGFERNILAHVRDKFELIGGQEMIELERLQEDRNRCAHPTLQREGLPYQPTGEVARAHLCNAMIYVLHQPPVQGRSALAELRKLVSSEYFPRDSAPAKQALQESVFARPSDALIRGAVDELVFGFFEAGNSYRHNRRALAALSAVVEIRRGVAEPRLIDQTRRVFPSLSDQELQWFLGMIVVVPDCYRALTEAHHTKLNNYIANGPLDAFSPLAERAYRLPELSAAVKQRVGKLDAVQLASLVKAGMHEPAIERAVELYCGVRNWGDANFVATNLVMPLLAGLKKQHLERIIQAPTKEGADLPGSHGFSEFLEKVRSEKTVASTELDQLLRDNGLEYYIPDEEAAPTSDGGEAASLL